MWTFLFIMVEPGGQKGEKEARRERTSNRGYSRKEGREKAARLGRITVAPPERKQARDGGTRVGDFFAADDASGREFGSGGAGEKLRLREPLGW